jgi:hypothetical protein
MFALDWLFDIARILRQSYCSLHMNEGEIMKRTFRVLLAVGLVVPMILLSGCLFNVFQTAKMLQSGDMSVLVGSGLMDIGIDESSAWVLTPQARLNFGLSNSVNLGIHTGALIPLSTGEPGWLGVAGDLKFSLVNNPESISLSAGFGAGYGLHFIGFGVFGEVFLDLNVFPLFFAYQPTIPLSGEGFMAWHDVSIGMPLVLSEKARLIIQVDTRNLALFSYGLAFEISF